LTFLLLYVHCTGWAKLTMPVIIGVNFHPVHGSGGPDDLRHGQVQTLMDPLTRPNFDGKVKKSVMFLPCLLTYVGHCIPFQPIKHQTCFPCRIRWTHLAHCLLLLIEVRSMKSKNRNDILQSFG